MNAKIINTIIKYGGTEVRSNYTNTQRTFNTDNLKVPINNLMELLYLYKKSDDEVFPTLDNEIKYSVINHTICS